MATTKTFSVAGTSRLPNGTVKVRFAKDFVQRISQMLINHPKFQSEEQQGAISEFVVRNCSKDVQKEVSDAVESNSESTEETPVEA